MKIQKITIQNFRQFFGQHSLEFSTDEVKGITVIHGENGSGKTSLLNAFKWCFYGHADFDTGLDNILNEQAIVKSSDGEDIELSIKIDFEHEGSDYTASRVQRFIKTTGLKVDSIGGSVFKLRWIDQNGSCQESTNADTQMNQILPEKMHSYFFFNGERIEKLANASSSGQIREAIKTLMGLQIVERAGIHLEKYVIKEFKKELKKQSPGKLQEVIDRETKLQEEIDSLKERMYVTKDNKKFFKDEISKISSRLAMIKDVAALQDERKFIENRLDTIKKSKDSLSASIKDLISTKGFLPFFTETAATVGALLEEKRKRGELPYKIKQQFIDDLLSNGKCICGTCLNKGEENYSNVEKYRLQASSKGLEEAFITTAGAIKQVDRSKSDLFRAIKDNIKQGVDLESERDKLSGRLDVISKKLQESEVESVPGLENKRKEIEEKLDKAQKELGKLEFELETKTQEHKEAKRAREEITDVSQQYEKISKRLSNAEECARVAKALHVALSNQTREKLSKRVDKTFKDIIRKPYWAEIDQDYTLQIYREIEGHGKQLVPEKSTAESQITSLSFISSIVNLAKEQQNQDSDFIKGGVFPIIMDSPFGSIDDEYRALIARYIPMLADQVIVFASSSQWRGPVSKECAPRLGKEYSLIYHCKEVDEGRESYYVRPGADFEFSEIEEGYHG
ncbi:AAA family ATPase [Geothermobacter hydrogeniphilus]|uniref:AAA family ATPase n=1 Tax=Geothermobacter hydrogeniphilus TaxID=1969733 RepID=UPI001304EABA|nr:AAA family ATPase [Geothermobacter hydrogeniphilus]